MIRLPCALADNALINKATPAIIGVQRNAFIRDRTESKKKNVADNIQRVYLCAEVRVASHKTSALFGEPEAATLPGFALTAGV